jgi:hypothetical protein
MKIHLISLCILTSAIGNYGDSTRINCKNSQLNVNGCGCDFEESLNYSILECPSILAPNLNELPTLPGNI